MLLTEGTIFYFSLYNGTELSASISIWCAGVKIFDGYRSLPLNFKLTLI